MSLLAPLLEVTKLMARRVIYTSSPRRKGRTCASTSKGSAGVQYNIPDVCPTAVISAFHQNVRNRKMRKELAMNKVRDVAELYVLADRCARAEEGRKYPGKDAGAETDSIDDTATPTKKGRCRNRKHRSRACRRGIRRYRRHQETQGE